MYTYIIHLSNRVLSVFPEFARFANRFEWDSIKNLSIYSQSISIISYK